MAPNESVFIVYPAEGVHEGYGESSLQLQKEKKDIARASLNIALEAKEYTITFAANKKTLTRQELFDWSQESDEQIRYYSGTATYKTTFRWKNKPNKDQQIYLNLGTVYNLATVRVSVFLIAAKVIVYSFASKAMFKGALAVSFFSFCS